MNMHMSAQRCRRGVVFSVLALLLAGCAAVTRAPSQPTLVLEMDREGVGVLSQSDPRLADGSVYQAWSFVGEVGEALQVDLMSTDFDAFLILNDRAGKTLARDDDGGDGTNARIRIVLPASGRYHALANSVAAGEYGRYTIRLSRATGEGVKRGVVGAITRGQTVSGTLSVGDDRLPDNSAFHAYTFEARAGEGVRIELSSRDFDAYLLVFDYFGNRLVSDDDSGPGKDARIEYVFPFSGTVHIVANAFRRDEFGEYQLTVH